MFTLIAWSGSVPTGSVLRYVPAVADQHIRVEGNNIVVPAGMNHLLGAFALSANLAQVQIESPALRRTLLYDVIPLNVGVEPLSPVPFMSLFYNPIPLDEFEPLRALAYHSGTTAEQVTVFVWLGDGAQSPVSGEIYTVMATSNTTLTPYAWTNGALTFTQTLPAGTYQVVGFRAQSAGLLAARLVFVGGTWRPGVIGCDAISDIGPEIFRRGGVGIFGEFRHDQPPTVDFFSSSADTSETVWLDLIKTG
jgi:hypothetical protein